MGTLCAGLSVDSYKQIKEEGSSVLLFIGGLAPQMGIKG